MTTAPAVANDGARDRSLVVVVSFSANCLLYLIVSILTPLYPQVARDLRVSPDALAAIVGLSAVTGLFTYLPGGVLIDLLGRRRLLLLGVLGLALVQCVRALAESPAAYAFGQVLLGLSGPVIISSSQAAVAGAFAGHGRAQAFGITLVGVQVGQAAGILAATVLGFTLDWHAIALLGTLPALALALIVIRMPEERGSAAAAPFGSAIRQSVALLRGRAGLALVSLVALTMGAGGAALFILPFVVQGHGFGYEGTAVLFVPFILGAIIGGPVVGRAADRYGVRTPLLIVLFMGTLAGAGLSVSQEVLLLALCYFVFGAVTTVSTSLAASAASDLADRVGGVGIAAALASVGVGRAMGPMVLPAVVAATYVRGGVAPAFVVMAGLYLLGTAAAALALSAADR